MLSFKDKKASVPRVLAFFPYIAGCVAIFLVSNMSRVPMVENVNFRFADKVMHAGAYALLALLALVGTWFLTRPWVLAFLLSTGRGVADELHQSFVPGRNATFGDVLADAFGAFIMLAAAYFAWRKFADAREIEKKL